jgi:hypothetical protein
LKEFWTFPIELPGDLSVVCEVLHDDMGGNVELSRRMEKGSNEATTNNK